MKTAVSLLLLISLLFGMFAGVAETDFRDAEPETVSFVFYSDVNPKNMLLDAEVPYGDCLFEEAATSYNHVLAQASMGIAFSNFREKGKAPEEQGYATRNFLTAIGFKDIQADQYDVDTTSDTVASMIARKETVINGEPCTLISVSICGAGYNNEWLSNFAFSEEDRHTGFDRAADKVLGRLLLYLFNHPVEDHVKLWISGYSRAAAIANLLGQKLSNEKICPVEDLYVYTFAAPNTAIAKSAWPCPSVYNIVGSFDPIPTIPPVEWGYARYGTTLFLPAQEIDSDYLLHRKPVEKIYRDLTGIEYWNNPNCNWILQKLLQILYSNIKSAEIYSSFVKDIISGMWATSGILPRIRLLSDMMTANVVTDSSVRSLFSSFKEVLSPFLFNLITRSKNDKDRYWGDGVSPLTQVLHEHNPEVYYAWMKSSDDPDELFVSSPAFYRVSLTSDLKIDGIHWLENDETHLTQEISGISFDVNTVLNIPRDHTYMVSLTAERDIRDEMVAINGYTLPSLEANVTIITLNLKAGESAYLLLPADGVPEIRDSSLLSESADTQSSVFQTHVYAEDERKAAMLEYSQSGWLARNLIDLLLWIPVLLLCILAFFIIRVNIRIKKKVFYVRRAFITLMVVFFFLDQLLRNLFPWGVLAIIICQGICSVSGAIIAFFAWYRKRDRYTLLLFLSMLFWTVGDVMTKTNSLIGTASYGLGHLLICFAFCTDQRPNRRHFLILAASVALVFTVEIMTTSEISELIPSMIYTILILSMCILSSLRGKTTMAGGLLFLISDLLLTLKTILNAPGWLFFLTLGTYYLSVAILSSSAHAEAEPFALKADS